MTPLWSIFSSPTREKGGSWTAFPPRWSIPPVPPPAGRAGPPRPPALSCCWWGCPSFSPPRLPFTPTEEIYTAYWSELAQVTYSDGTQTAVFRKSAGTEDNSGDYTVYETALQLELEDYTVTLKGDAGGYVLAVWSKDGYAYSLKLSASYPQEEWETILNTL